MWVWGEPELLRSITIIYDKTGFYLGNPLAGVYLRLQALFSVP